MAKNPPMRVLKRDEAEFKRLRRNYRSKLNRIRKSTGFPLSDIDDWLGIEVPTIRELKNGSFFKSRKEYNEWKLKINTVNKRTFSPLQIETNERGMRYPRIVEKIGIDTVKKAQKSVENLIENYRDLPVLVDGEPIGTVEQRELMLGDREAFGVYKPEDFDIDNYTNPTSVEKNIKRNEERKDQQYYLDKMVQMQNNFISMFEHTDDDNNDLLADRLRAIPPDDFYELTLMIPEMAFEDFDSETGNHISNQSSADVLSYYLDIYEQGKIDLSLKGVG